MVDVDVLLLQCTAAEKMVTVKGEPDGVVGGQDAELIALIRVNVDEESLQDKQMFDVMLCVVQVAAVGVGGLKYMCCKGGGGATEDDLAKVRASVFGEEGEVELKPLDLALSSKAAMQEKGINI